MKKKWLLKSNMTYFSLKYDLVWIIHKMYLLYAGGQPAPTTTPKPTTPAPKPSPDMNALKMKMMQALMGK